MALIQIGYQFEDTDKNMEIVFCPYGNRKPCSYDCVKLRIKNTPEGKKLAVFNCGGKPLEIEMYTLSEWDKLHSSKVSETVPMAKS